MAQSSYYVPEQSKWPIIGSIGLITTVFGAGTMLNQMKAGADVNGHLIFFTGALIMAFLLFRWFSGVIRESHAGLYSAQLSRSFVYAMSWFIFSEVMFFAAFFGALFYTRVYAVAWLGGSGDNVATQQLLWPEFQSTWPLLNTPNPTLFPAPKAVIHALGVPLINTFLLISSSFTVTFAHHALEKADRAKLKLWMLATIALGVAFLVLQVSEYHEAYTELGLTLKSGIYGSTFFMLTGFHGMHVTIGTLMLIIMLLRILKGHFEPAPDKHFAFRATAWYWHFVDVVWVMLYIFVYLL